MIIHYKLPFHRFRKVARTYSKMDQKICSILRNRKLLKNLNGEKIDYRDIPVIINNYNRIDHLLKLINWLENAETRHIFIIDNASTYAPLVDYYKTTKHTVIQLNTNIGYKSIWDTRIHLWFSGLPYIYTDPDILPVNECPLNAIQYFQKKLDEHENINKVGFGIKIDDIPDFYPNKTQVLEWENKFWDNKIDDNTFKADIDTTFALYRANSVKQQWGKTLRTGGNYLVRHLPWYENPDIVSEEEAYYRKLAVTSSWYKN